MKSQEAKEIIDAGDAIVIDIRDENTFNMGHIPNAININDQNIEKFIEETDKNSKILCCCYYGVSSQNAVAYLTEKGFADVHNLEGGYEAWKIAFPS